VTDRQRWLALGFVIAVSAFFHGAVLLTRPIEPGADASSYTVPARELLRHHRFDGPGLIVYAYPLPERERPGPETLRTPGYPLFLAAILALGLPLEAAVWIQHLLGVALAAAVFLFADLVLRRRAAAVIAALLVGTQPAILLVAHDYMAELLFTAVVAAALFCAYRALRGGAGAWAAAAGLLTGVAALIRPIALVWFVPLAVFMIVRERRRAAAFLVAALVLPLAWAARNYAAVGVATVSSVSGEEALFYNAAGALAIEDKPLLYRLSALQQPTGFYNAWEKLKPRLGEAAFAEMRADGIDPRRAPHAVLARAYSRLGRRILLRHLPEAAELAVSACIELFVYTYARPAASHEWLTVIAGIAIFAFACRGLAVLRRDDPVCAFLIAATIVAFAIPAASAVADIRFAIPFAPAYAIAAGAGITARGRAATAAPAPRK